MGVIRVLDGLNRVRLPEEVYPDLGWARGTQLELAVFSDHVTVSLWEPACRLCGRRDGTLVPVGNGRVCPGCLMEGSMKLGW